MASKATDKRIDAITAILRDSMAPNGALWPGTTRTRLIGSIDALRPLGRTERWQGCLDRWERMARNEEFDLHWVIVQGAIFAGYAAR